MSATKLSDTGLALVKASIKAHRLPAEFVTTVTEYYWPLCRDINRRQISGQCNFIGIQGSQGSGKSTCASFIKTILENEYQLKVLVASIDDFYLTLSERQVLSKTVHPLLLTRGVPGTHDTDLINKLALNAGSHKQFSHPVFNKAIDDRLAENEWMQHTGPYDVLILEGWCVGITAQEPQALARAVNDLELSEDQSQQWRSHVNAVLSDTYQDIFKKLDLLISLQAPSFDCIFSWRSLQEEKMITKLEEAGADTSATLSPAEIKRFISHYQRLTEHALETMPNVADVVLYLNSDHQFTRMVGVDSLRDK